MRRTAALHQVLLGVAAHEPTVRRGADPRAGPSRTRRRPPGRPGAPPGAARASRPRPTGASCARAPGPGPRPRGPACPTRSTASGSAAPGPAPRGACRRLPGPAAAPASPVVRQSPQVLADPERGGLVDDGPPPRQPPPGRRGGKPSSAVPPLAQHHPLVRLGDRDGEDDRERDAHEQGPLTPRRGPGAAAATQAPACIGLWR